MAKNKADLLALINTNLPDNTTKTITPTKLREVETQMTDSNLNTLESTTQVVAGLVNFTGGLFAQTSSHGWVLAPTALIDVSKVEGVA